MCACTRSGRSSRNKRTRSRKARQCANGEAVRSSRGVTTRKPSARGIRQQRTVGADADDLVTAGAHGAHQRQQEMAERKVDVGNFDDFQGSSPAGANMGFVATGRKPTLSASSTRQSPMLGLILCVPDRAFPSPPSLSAGDHAREERPHMRGRFRIIIRLRCPPRCAAALPASCSWWAITGLRSSLAGAGCDKGIAQRSLCFPPAGSSGVSSRFRPLRTTATSSATAVRFLGGRSQRWTVVTMQAVGFSRDAGSPGNRRIGSKPSFFPTGSSRVYLSAFKLWKSPVTMSRGVRHRVPRRLI